MHRDFKNRGRRTFDSRQHVKAAVIVPGTTSPAKLPRSGKQRRQMLRSAAWRLSQIVHRRHMQILSLPDPLPLVQLAPRAKRGEAIRLVRKLSRLKELVRSEP